MLARFRCTLCNVATVASKCVRMKTSPSKRKPPFAMNGGFLCSCPIDPAIFHPHAANYRLVLCSRTAPRRRFGEISLIPARLWRLSVKSRRISRIWPSNGPFGFTVWRIVAAFEWNLAAPVKEEQPPATFKVERIDLRCVRKGTHPPATKTAAITIQVTAAASYPDSKSSATAWRYRSADGRLPSLREIPAGWATSSLL